MPSRLSLSGQSRQVLLHTVLSLLTSCLLLLVFPKFDVHWLAPVALSPILIAMAKTDRLWLRFAYGLGAGIFFWFFLCTWIQFVLQRHGDMGAVGSWAAFMLFCILKSLHLAVFCSLAGPLMRMPWSLPAVAALWTGLERTHGTFGFAWLDLGNAGIDMALPLRLAPLVGVYGLSFVFAMMAAGLAIVFLRRSRRELLPLLLLPGLFLLPEIPQNQPARQSALVVQPNIDPSLEWTALAQWQAEQRLRELSTVLNSPLVIWPELPAPLYFYEDRDFRKVATSVALRGSYFLFGTVAYNASHQPLNSAVLLQPDGQVVGRYDKIDLVPFGEFIPPAFSFINRISREVGDFAPGSDIKVLRAGRMPLGVFICYESAFPDLVRQFVKKGAGVLVNLSNDAYFGHSEARVQHLALVRMRAVETNRYVVRSTNDGITAVIDPAGVIRYRLPPFHEIAASVHFGIRSGVTFYARHGDLFAWSCLVFGLASALHATFSNRVRRGPDSRALQNRSQVAPVAPL